MPASHSPLLSAVLSDLTIVIPTLSNNFNSLWLETMHSLLLNSANIFLVVPLGTIPRVQYLTPFLGEFLHILHSPKVGQVAQRVYGFQNVKTPYVLQLDDDVEISLDTIIKMLEIVRSIDFPLALAPVIDDSSYVKAGSLPKFIIGLKNLVYFFSLLPIPGSVAISAFPVPHQKSVLDNVVATEWLPGCCVLHSTANLVLDSFFPFSGKAYCEDLIHSHLLLSRGISLAICTSLRIYTRVTSYKILSFSDFYRYLVGDVQARLYFSGVTRRNPFLTFPAYTLIIFSYFFHRLLPFVSRRL